MSAAYARALALFDEFVELGAAEQARRLEELTRRDPPLHAALQALLQADRDRPYEALLSQPPAQMIAEWQRSTATGGSDDDPNRAEDDGRIGARLGSWRIDHVIAHGGMGTVYAADRDDGQYQQRVALKCIRLELDTPQLHAAFRRERELLAQLDNPGIAGLIDGGVDGDGHPWFAMRLVQGAPIDAWCDAQRAPIRKRVELLLQACRALAYAHAHGVVHGDIKPSNVLVGADARVQLVDFGIASVREARVSHVGITPDYAAPEYLGLGQPTVSSDVYAFGVLIYRLLCGQWPTPAHTLRGLLGPIDAEGQSMQRLLAHAPDSIAQARGEATVAALSRALAGDLSAIVRKAVMQRPEARYSSITELAADLQRWLDHRPVSANPLGWGGRLRRFARRNPLPVGLATALALVLIATLAAEYRNREQRMREAQANESVGRLFISTLGTATLSGLSKTPLSSQALLDQTERELRKLPLSEHPPLLGRSLATLARSRAAIGDFRGAERLSDEAVRALGTASDYSGDVAAMRISLLNLRGRYRQADSLARAGLLQLAERTDDNARRARIGLHAEIARAEWGLFQPQLAVRTLDRALVEAQALKDDERTAELLITRGDSNLVLMRFRQAESDDRRAIALASPTNPILADDAREQLLRVLIRRQAPEAFSVAEQLLANRRRTLGEHHPKTGYAWIRLSMVDGEHPHEAQIAAEKGLALIEAAYGRDHPEYASAIGLGVWRTARTQDEKIAMLQHAIQVLDRTVGPASERALTLRNQLGTLLVDFPDGGQRQAYAERGMDILEGVIRTRHASGVPASNEVLRLGNALVAFGPDERLPEAQSLLRESERDAAAYFSKDDSYPRITALFRDKLLYRSGQRAQADLGFAGRIDANRAFIAKASIDYGGRDSTLAEALHQSMLYRAFYAYENCDRPRAEVLLSEALRFDTHIFEEGDFVREARELSTSLADSGKLLLSRDSTLIAHSELAAVNARAAACRRRGAGR